MMGRDVRRCPLVKHLRRRLQPDHDGDGAQRIDISWIEYRSAAHAKDRRRRTDNFPDRFGLSFAKTGLALGREDFGDRPARSFDDHVVGIDALASQESGGPPPPRPLSAPPQTPQPAALFFLFFLFF